MVEVPRARDERVQLADPAHVLAAGQHARAAPGMQERLGRGLHVPAHAHGVERGAEHALGGEEARPRRLGRAPRLRVQAADEHAGQRAVLVRELGAVVAVDVAGLEERAGRAGRARRCGARRRAATPRSVVRMTVWSSLIGFSRATKRRRGSSGARRSRSASPGSVKLQPTISYMPRPTSASIARRRRRCWTLRRPALPRRLGSVAGSFSRPSMRATSSMRSASRVTSLRRKAGTSTSRPPGASSTLEAQRAQDLGLARARDRDARGAPRRDARAGG